MNIKNVKAIEPILRFNLISMQLQFKYVRHILGLI